MTDSITGTNIFVQDLSFAYMFLYITELKTPSDRIAKLLCRVMCFLWASGAAPKWMERRSPRDYRRHRRQPKLVLGKKED